MSENQESKTTMQSVIHFFLFFVAETEIEKKQAVIFFGLWFYFEKRMNEWYTNSAFLQVDVAQ